MKDRVKVKSVYYILGKKEAFMTIDGPIKELNEIRKKIDGKIVEKL